MKKKQIEKILGRKLFDYEYEFFNMVMQAKKEGKKIYISTTKRAFDYVTGKYIDNVSNNKLNGGN